MLKPNRGVGETADIAKPKDTQVKSINRIKPTNIKNLSAAGCNPTIQYAIEQNSMGKN